VAIFDRERKQLVQPKFESVRTQRAQVEQMIDEWIIRGIETGEFKPLPSIRLATSRRCWDDHVAIPVVHSDRKDDCQRRRTHLC
jgi:Tetracyclin repressor-like, C-terminal domain